jgi:hypothetical protein
MKVTRKQVEENLRRGIPVSYGQMTLIVCKSKVSNKAVSFQSIEACLAPHRAYDFCPLYLVFFIESVIIL